MRDGLSAPKPGVCSSMITNGPWPSSQGCGRSNAFPLLVDGDSTVVESSIAIVLSLPDD